MEKRVEDAGGSARVRFPRMENGEGEEAGQGAGID